MRGKRARKYRIFRSQYSETPTHLVVLGMNHVLGPDGVPQQLARIDIAVPEVGDLSAS